MYIYSRAEENKQLAKNTQRKKTTGCTTFRDTTHMHTQHTRIFQGISRMRHKICAIKTIYTRSQPCFDCLCCRQMEHK